MKKLIMLMVCCIAVTTTFAQSIRFGLSVSPQLSWMNAGDNTLEKNGTNFGFAYGLLLDKRIGSDNYALATGLLVSYTGGSLIYITPTEFRTFEDSFFAAHTEVDYRIQYLEIPFSIKLKTNEIGYITYWGQFGLQGGLKIRTRADIFNALGEPIAEKEDFGKDVTPANIGLLIGGGLEYNLSGNTSLVTGIQFSNGFIDVTNNPSGFKTKSALSYLRLQIGMFF